MVPAETLEVGVADTGAFLLGRAEAEHAAAERKREAGVTKASGIATLAAALIAIVAAPAFDLASPSGSLTRWTMLVAIVLFLVTIGCAAGALLVHVAGDRVSREELDNWTTDEFQAAAVAKHLRDFTEMFVAATKSLRAANDRAETWMSRAIAGLGAGLVVLAIAFVVEIA